MAIRLIDGNALIERFRPYLHTGESIPADVVIEGILSMPTLTPPNDPLTLEQLREMDGEPVYLISAGISEWNVLGGETLITTAYDVPRTGLKTVADGIRFINGREFRQDHYSKTWWAYRRPPEGEA